MAIMQQRLIVARNTEKLHRTNAIAMLCVLCDRALETQAERCITDCAHEFCLACICRELTERRNACPICAARVKTVHQLEQSDGGRDAPTAVAGAPASIRFNNAVYVLHVSIWSVEDPARKLAELFDLEQARLIHKGKMLKKGDVWPGTVVQLFGTRKTRGSSHTGGLVSWSDTASAWLQGDAWRRVVQIVCCPLLVIIEFFRSLFVNVTPERRGYQRIEPPVHQGATAARQQQSFHEPGRVGSPHYVDSVE
ncbi:hypothetical protein PINS_up009170 [Pythium insidiosum]|nr:hypothetical protein PINS_up009170 [Pythium insidiosum]